MPLTKLTKAKLIIIQLVYNGRNLWSNLNPKSSSLKITFMQHDLGFRFAICSWRNFETISFQNFVSHKWQIWIQITLLPQNHIYTGSLNISGVCSHVCHFWPRPFKNFANHKWQCLSHPLQPHCVKTTVSLGALQAPGLHIWHCTFGWGSRY